MNVHVGEVVTETGQVVEPAQRFANKGCGSDYLYRRHFVRNFEGVNEGSCATIFRYDLTCLNNFSTSLVATLGKFF